MTSQHAHFPSGSTCHSALDQPQPVSNSSKPSCQQIGARARALWEARGRPIGPVAELWSEAHSQLLRELVGD